MPHEISRGANFVPWSTHLPYAYASADETPLFILVVDDYVEASRIRDFPRELRDKLSSAYNYFSWTVWNLQEISSTEGTVLRVGDDSHASLRVSFSEGVARTRVTIQFISFAGRRLDPSVSREE